MDPKHVGRSWYPPHRSYNMFVSLYTDASKYGWGAHFHGNYCADVAVATKDNAVLTAKQKTALAAKNIPALAG